MTLDLEALKELAGRATDAGGQAHEEILSTMRALDERRKIKYSIPPDDIREGSDLLERSQHMVDPGDLYRAVLQLQTLALLHKKIPSMFTALIAEVERLREALKPFAAGTDVFFADDPDDRVVSLGRWHGGEPLSQELPRLYADIALTVAHFRRARAALSPTPPADKEG
jgi:hypothetical protein